MATYTLVPDETEIPDAGNWSINTASTIHEAIDAVTGGYVHTASTGKDFRVGFTSTLLAGNETIDSIQACITGHTGNTRSATHDVRIDIENASNADYFTDTHTVTVNGGAAATYCSAAETTSDGSTAWTQGDMDAIRMDGEVTSAAAGHSAVLYEAYLTVVTTVTVVAVPKVLTVNGVLTINGNLTIK